MYGQIRYMDNSLQEPYTMNADNFVILILCEGADLDDLMHERKRHRAVMIDVLHYDSRIDYFSYRDNQCAGKGGEDISLMFVFGKNDSVVIRDEMDMQRVKARLQRGEC